MHFKVVEHDPEKRTEALIHSEARFRRIAEPSARLHRAGARSVPLLVSLGGDRAVEDAYRVVAKRGRCEADVFVYLPSTGDANEAKRIFDVSEFLEAEEPRPRFLSGVSRDDLRRFLHGHAVGAPEEIIVSASASGHILRVTSAEPRSYFFDVREIRGLRDLSDEELANFQVSRLGLSIEWKGGDLTLDLHGLKLEADLSYREEALAASMSRCRHYGAAIRARRRAEGLRQRDVDGISERHLRRIEQGEVVSTKVLEALASAHGESLLEYLNRVAEVAERLSLSPGREHCVQDER